MEEIQKVLEWLKEEFKDDNDSLNFINKEINFNGTNERFFGPLLKEIKIQNCGLYKKPLNIVFNQKGITLLIGSNGSGKTTTIEYLIYSLTGKPPNSLKELYIKESRKLKIITNLELNNEDHIIERTIPYKNRRTSTNFRKEDEENINKDYSGININNLLLDIIFGFKNKIRIASLFNIIYLPEFHKTFLISEGKDETNIVRWIFNLILGHNNLNNISRMLMDSISAYNKDKRGKEEWIHTMQKDINKANLIPDIAKLRNRERILIGFKSGASKIKKNYEKKRSDYQKVLFSDMDNFKEFRKTNINIQEKQNQIIQIEKSIRSKENELNYLFDSLKKREYITYAHIACSKCLSEVKNRHLQKICILCEKDLNSSTRQEIKPIQTQIQDLIIQKEGIIKEKDEFGLKMTTFLKEKSEKKRPLLIKIGYMEVIIKKYDKIKKDLNIEIRRIKNQISKKTSIDDNLLLALNIDLNEINQKIQNLNSINSRLKNYDINTREKFFNGFNKDFENLIQKITHKPSIIKFSNNGSIQNTKGINFKTYGGEEKIVYEIAFRLLIYKNINNLGFKFPLIIENGGFALDSVIKENLVKTIQEYSLNNNLPIIITSSDEEFSSNLIKSIKSKDFIYYLNDFTDNTTESQNNRMNSFKMSLEMWI